MANNRPELSFIRNRGSLRVHKAPFFTNTSLQVVLVVEDGDADIEHGLVGLLVGAVARERRLHDQEDDEHVLLAEVAHGPAEEANGRLPGQR